MQINSRITRLFLAYLSLLPGARARSDVWDYICIRWGWDGGLFMSYDGTFTYRVRCSLVAINFMLGNDVGLREDM